MRHFRPHKAIEIYPQCRGWLAQSGSLCGGRGRRWTTYAASGLSPAGPIRTLDASAARDHCGRPIIRFPVGNGCFGDCRRRKPIMPASNRRVSNASGFRRGTGSTLKTVFRHATAPVIGHRHAPCAETLAIQTEIGYNTNMVALQFIVVLWSPCCTCTEAVNYDCARPRADNSFCLLSPARCGSAGQPSLSRKTMAAADPEAC
jgi:hypothetical protein